MNRTRLSPAFCSANKIVVIGTEGAGITFGMINPEDAILKARIEKTHTGNQCVFLPITPDEFNLKLSQLYAEDNDGMPGSGEDAEDRRKSVIDHIADDAPVINLLNSIFLEAVSKKASDIHIESGEYESRVRFRVDGILLPIRTISQERTTAVSARLKLLANLNVLENRRPQDGHIDITAESYSLDVRISITPTIWGESIVLRLLNRSDSLLSLDSLGFSAKHREYIAGILTVSSGLVLVTGPTGSGKTTTLAALLSELRQNESKIISIEDPVEYRIEGITQIQVNDELGLTFNAVLRRIFRQDPDIILVGEIRDTETAELAVRAALTGHLVFATLHTNDAPEAVYRLQNMGIPAYMVAAVLRAVIAQRLVRKVCVGCGASGCVLCAETGYRGRTVAAEILVFTTELSNLISGGIPPEKLRLALGKKGYKTFFDDAKEKADAGITTPEEIKRELGVRI
jgi:type II secretory ATPase GspE/PulE/Tfp pilus assembly ATPase PilB-like protein